MLEELRSVPVLDGSGVFPFRLSREMETQSAKTFVYTHFMSNFSQYDN